MCLAGVRLRVPAGIGAPFGVERCFDLGDSCAQPLRHFLDDVIAPDAQAPCRDLRRQMPVAEMPGEANQMLGVTATDLHQRLWRGHNLDQSAVVEHERVAAPQRHRMFQIEQELKPVCARHRHPPPVAVVEIEHDGVGRRFAPAVVPANLRGADHAKTLISISGLRHLRA